MTSSTPPPAVPGLAGKAILITGGGSGLGAALCRTLAAAGARILVTDRDAARAAATLDSLPPVSEGAPHGTLAFDVGDPEAALHAIETMIERYRGIDVLINNAGTDVTCAIDALSQADWDRVLRTNLSGPFQLARAALPCMKRQRAGQIINIASTAAKRAWPNASAYHASKWGLLGLSHAMHAELREFGIKVTAVIAGGMRTPFLLDRFPELDPANLQDPANVAAVVRGLLLLPLESVVPEVTVLPMKETSWP